MNEQRIVLVDLRIPFFRLVFFFIKAILATTVAAIVLGVLFSLIAAILMATVGSSNMDLMMRRWTF